MILNRWLPSWRRPWWLAITLLLLSHPILAQEVPSPVADVRPVQIAIIIDDLGLRLQQDLRVLALPGAITHSILPRATYAHRIAGLASNQNKEVMIHLPMEAVNHSQLDAGGLTVDMAYPAFKSMVEAHIAALPEAVGVNNHMGSLLTTNPVRMRWLMDILNSNQTDLYFVDSRTSIDTVALHHARHTGVPSLRRDIFLDNELDEVQIERQFDALIKLAQRRGKAVAIGHPNSETIAVLERRLPTLVKLGVELVPVSELLRPKKAQSFSLSEQTKSVSEPARVAKGDAYERFISQSGTSVFREPVRSFYRLDPYP